MCKIFRVLLLLLPFMVMVSCKDIPREVEIVERRELCQYDNPKVYKNGYDSLIARQPISWRRVNGTEFRLLNYVCGEATEIAVGRVDGGGVLANLNRWKREFAQEVLADLDGVEITEMFGGRKAYVIQLEGEFQKKMSGMPVKVEGWAVTGLICDLGGGTLITVKMMGPQEEVKEHKSDLMVFAKSIEFNKLQKPNERSKGGDKEKEGLENEEGGY